MKYCYRKTHYHVFLKRGINMEKHTLSIEKNLEEEDWVQDQIDDIISELIKERKKKKITQIDLSKISGIPQTTISRLESFSSVPTLQILIRLSTSLDRKLVLI